MASTAAEKPNTVKDLKAALDAASVEYDAKAKKAELEKLYDEKVAASAPTDSSSEDVSPEDAPGSAGPSDLDPDPGAAPEDYDGPVLLKGLVHEGLPLPAGAPVPQNLSESDVERLQKLGIICGGEAAVTGFDVFKGEDGDFYWHLRAENGEIVAQGEGYSSEQAAWRGVDAVKQAVADAD